MSTRLYSYTRPTLNSWSLFKISCGKSIFRSFSTVKLTEEISSEEKEQYHRDGAVCLRAKISQEWIKKLEKAVQWNLEHPSEFSENLLGSQNNIQPIKKEQGSAFFNDYCNWKIIPELKDFLFQTNISKIARALMNSKTVTFYHEHVLVKEPGCLRTTPWHHDLPYYPLNANPTDTVTLWIPLDPVFKSENAVQYIAGSHRGPWYVPRKFKTAEGYPLLDNKNTSDWSEKNYQTIDEELIANKTKQGKIKILSWDMQPGDVVAFSFLTLHGAPGNITTNRRRVVTFRFVGDGVTITKRRPWEVSPPIFGNLKEGQELREDPNLFPDMTPLIK